MEYNNAYSSLVPCVKCDTLFPAIYGQQSLCQFCIGDKTNWKLKQEREEKQIGFELVVQKDSILLRKIPHQRYRHHNIHRYPQNLLN